MKQSLVVGAMVFLAVVTTITLWYPNKTPSSPNFGIPTRHSSPPEQYLPNNTSRASALVVMFLPSAPSPSKASFSDFAICDGLAVLRASFQHSPLEVNAHVLMLAKDRAWSDTMRNAGYDHIFVEPPQEIFRITNVALRARLEGRDGRERDGIVGVYELIKLYPLLWTNYSMVICLDADVMVNPSGAHQILDLLKVNTSIAYTQTARSKTNRSKIWPLDINGGVLVFYPSNKTILHSTTTTSHYHNMMKIFESGSWTEKDGWHNSRVGRGWGGTTIQGLVPYYFEMRVPNERTSIPYCVFNNNVKHCWEKNGRVPAFVHFSAPEFCPKPWKVFSFRHYPKMFCANDGHLKYKGMGICAEFIRTWYNMYEAVVTRAVRTGWNEPHMCPKSMLTVNDRFFSLTRFLSTQHGYHPACWYRGINRSEMGVPALATYPHLNRARCVRWRRNASSPPAKRRRDAPDVAQISRWGRNA